MNALKLLLASIALAVIAGCGGSTEPEVTAEGDTKVKLSLNWKAEPQFGGFYAAEVIGAYKEQKLEVEVSPGGSGTPTVQMVAAGTTDFGIVSGGQLLQMRANGADVVALFAVYQTNPQGIMVRKSLGVESIEDVFKGGKVEKVAMQQGLPYAKHLKKKYGFDKVKLLAQTGGITLFRNDEKLAQQCFVTSEPLTAKKAGLDVQTFLVADAGYNPYTTVMICRRDYLEKNPEVVKGMVKAVRKGWESYLKDPKATNAVMGKINTVMDAETFKASAEAQLSLIQNDVTKEKGLGYMTRERWESLKNQLREMGELSKDISVDDAFINLK